MSVATPTSTATTTITIEHLPRSQRITVTRPGGAVDFQVEAMPTEALKTLAAWLERWADR